ncbi:glycosyltransferase [Vibrio vulnificus]|nr:glycosyltransferase [Vibrio vulnificus]
MYGGIQMYQLTSRDITCVISIYKGTALNEFQSSLDSVLSQTASPYKVIVVVDGPISNEISSYLLTMDSNVLSVYHLDKNEGPGYARDYGIRKATTSLIAIMDADDYSVPERFELQLEAFNSRDISVCGGVIEEFDNIGNVKKRVLPSFHNEIVSFSKIRSPINNVTAMFFKKDYIESGGYPNFRIAEDYCLWIRFIAHGFKVFNINSTLVKVKFDSDTLIRRKGFYLFRYDYLCQVENYKLKNIGFIRFIVNIFILAGFRLMPRRLLNIIYKRLLRK